MPTSDKTLLALSPPELAAALGGSGRARMVWRALAEGFDPHEADPASTLHDGRITAKTRALLQQRLARPAWTVVERVASRYLGVWGWGVRQTACPSNFIWHSPSTWWFHPIIQLWHSEAGGQARGRVDGGDSGNPCGHAHDGLRLLPGRLRAGERLRKEEERSID